MNTSLELSPGQYQQVRGIAGGRSAVQRRGNVRSLRVDKDLSDTDLDLIGVKGEYAVALVFGLTLPGVLPHGDGGVFDFLIGRLRVDVKTRNRLDGDFILPQTKEFKADAMILCESLPGSRRVNIAGWLTRALFLRERRLEDWGKGPTWMVPRALLLPIGSFPQ